MSFSIVTTNWFRLSLPLFLALLLWLGIDNLVSLTRSNLGFAVNLPYALFFGVIVFGHAFKQSRIGALATAMLLAYWLIQTRLQQPLSSGTTLLELSIISAVLPVACAFAHSIEDDANLLSRGYICYAVTLILLVIWGFLVLEHQYDGGFDNFHPAFLFIEPTVSRLPFVLTAFLLLIVLACTISVLRNNSIINAAIYTSTLMAFFTFVFFHVPYVSIFMFSLAGLLLLVYLLSASYELAFNDRLTGIPGRLALESDLKHLGRKYTIAMIDIDHFKSFNDTYGHDVGDEVLKLVASKLKNVGGRAKVYRYGGEEFTVLFKGKLVEEAEDHLELLRRSIEEYELVIRNSDSRPKDHKQGTRQRGKANSKGHVSLTISIGACDSSISRKTEEVIKIADQALYGAKKGGRNRIEIAC
ncbi:GGDEF domain-containing protein [Vibrio sonorensis]|uniref:GGDEF domain-containing protein n=1 Tax=Vibrio sonorensis TaxID=1004316 RepID=UPI0008D972AC|nr:GGDEF domain-containing protein [Vibrio sonorensis]